MATTGLQSSRQAIPLRARPALKRIIEVQLFSATLKRCSPLLKQRAPTKILNCHPGVAEGSAVLPLTPFEVASNKPMKQVLPALSANRKPAGPISTGTQTALY